MLNRNDIDRYPGSQQSSKALSSYTHLPPNVFVHQFVHQFSTMLFEECRNLWGGIRHGGVQR
jgi:hypothetical protein